MGLAGNDLLLHMGLASNDLLHMGLAIVLFLHMGHTTDLLLYRFCYYLLLHIGLYLLFGFLLHMGLPSYPAFSYTWGLDHLLLLLSQSWYQRTGYLMDKRIRLNIFVSYQRCFPSSALWVYEYAWISSFHISVVSHLRHYGYTNTPAYLRFMSASFPISDITSIQHTDAPEYCQRRFPFPASWGFSIWMLLNIVNVIFHSRHYKPLASHLGGGFTYRGLRIRFFGYVTWALKYSTDLNFLAFNISCGGEFYLSRFMHVIGYASDYSAMLLGPWSTLQTSFLLPSASHAGESFTCQSLRIWFFGFNIWTLEYDSATLLGPWITLQTSSFLPSVSHASCLQYLMRGRVLPFKVCASDPPACYLDLGVPCSPHPFCLQYLMRERGSTYQGSCTRSRGLNTGESLIKYDVFGLALTIIRRISQAKKKIHIFWPLSYSSQLLYHHWLSHVLLFHLKQKAFCGERLTQTVFIFYSGRFPYPSQLFYLGWLFYYRWSLTLYYPPIHRCKTPNFRPQIYRPDLGPTTLLSHPSSIAEDPISRQMHADSIENCTWIVSRVLLVGLLFDSAFSPFLLGSIRDFTKVGRWSISFGLFAFLSLWAQAVGAFGPQLLDLHFG